MANFNTASFPEFTDLVMRKFQQEKDSLKIELRNSGIFKPMDIPDGTGDTRRLGEIDSEEYAKNKAEGDDAAVTTPQYGYEKDLVLTRRALDITITWEMRKHNKEQAIMSRLRSLGRTVDNRMELDMAHRFTFCTSTTYTDQDGIVMDISMGDTLALASTAHTLTGSATTYRNILANNPQFSQGALEALELMVVENSYNLFGTKMASDMDVIFSSDDPTTKRAIKQLLGSSADISAQNAGVTNTFMANYRHVVISRLATNATGGVDSTKKKMFGLISSASFAAYLAVTEESHTNSPQAGSNAEDISTDDWRYSSRGEYGICIVSGRGFAVSLGDGSL